MTADAASTLIPGLDQFPFFPRRPPINPPPAWTTRPPTPQPTQGART